MTRIRLGPQTTRVTLCDELSYRGHTWRARRNIVNYQQCSEPRDKCTLSYPTQILRF